MEDYRVKALSNEQLEKIARLWTSGFKSANISTVNAYDALQEAGKKFVDVFGLEIITKSDAEMGERDAYATSPPPRIFVKEAVRELAKRNDPRARFTLFHEFAHIVLHPGEEPKARIARGNTTPAYIDPVNSAEHQANYFAAAFLMPRAEVAHMRSALEIQKEFNVSLSAAEIRFNQVVLPNLPRKLPDSVVAFQREIRSESKATNTNSLPSDAESAWIELERAPNYDPSQYRIARNFLIAKSEFKRMTPFGWFLENGRIKPFYMTEINAYS